MAEDIVVTPRVIIPGAELAFAFSRSGGPGGQNANKVASKVELRWNPTTSDALAGALSLDERAWVLQRLKNRLTTDGTLIITSTATRDQLKNRDDATEKLALIVRTALDRPKPRKPTKVSKGAKRRRVADKRHHAEIKRNRASRDD
jgi:ribosome-associated protein